MLSDEAQPAGSAGAPDRAVAGPRHAAPRKSLLTKLHMPAGKAVALAAMPTAVLMGMGFTPHLAQADEMPDNPFKAGPCVTRSDTPSPSPSATGTDGGGKGGTGKGTGGTSKPTESATAKPTASPGASDAPGDRPDPTVSPSASAPKATEGPVAGLLPKVSKSVKATQDAKAPKAEETAPAAPETTAPSATGTGASGRTSAKSTNPLDPLGLGDLLNGLLGGGKQPGTPTPAPTTGAPAPAPTTAAPGPAPSPSDITAPPRSSDSGGTSGGTAGGSSGGTSATGSAGKSGEDGTGGASGTAKKATKALTDATAGVTATPTPEATSTGVTDPTGTTGGKQPYPCPSYDAKALADAKTEPGIPLLPDAPWTLKSSMLTLYGLNYAGIVQVRTANGSVKDVLKFTATGVDIGDLHQIVDGPNGTHTHVRGRAGSTSTIRNGTVTMYTESLSGNLLGLIPITFTPKAPPPLTLPVLFFTDVTVLQAGQFGGDLTIPGMSIRTNQPS